MKKSISLFLLSTLMLLPVDARAQEVCTAKNTNFFDNCCECEINLYGEILGGVNFLQKTTLNGNKTTYQPGYIVSGSVGYYWNYGLRAEAEYAFRRNAIDKIQFFGQGSSSHGHFQTSSYMANILWDLPFISWGCTFWDIQPFVGAGIGYDSQQMHASNSRINFHQKWNHFSWQLMTGLIYPLFCDTNLALEYKFHQGGCHFYNHSIGVGLIYNFGLFN